MSKYRFLLFVPLVCLLLVLMAMPVFAVPPLPATFWGQVTLDGVDVPDGTEITAWVDGTQIGQVVSETFDNQSVYVLDARPPDTWDPDAGPPYTEGGTVVFRIGSSMAEQTATWTMGDENPDFHLSASTVYSGTAPISEIAPIELPGTKVTIDFDVGCSGTITVTLHNTAPVAPPEGVVVLSRYWTIESDCDEFSATLVFYYDESDLNGGSEDDLTGVACHVYGEWVFMTGVVDTTANTITVAGVTHFSDWIPIASNPPSRIADLDAAPAGSDVALSWSAVTQDIAGEAMTIDHYDVYRSLEPYFEPQASDLVATGLTSPNWTDLGATAGALNYYYVVKAVSEGGAKGAPSNRSGVFHVVTLPGWNLVSIPILVDNTGLDDVLGAQLHGSDDPGTADRVFAWDPVAKTYVSAWFCDAPSWGPDYHLHWLTGYSQTTITLGADEGVWIQNRAGGAETVTVAGPIAMDDRSIDLVNGWQLVGNAFPTARGLDDLGIPAAGSDDPTTADRIFVWDAASQTYLPSAWFCNQDWGEEYKDHWLTGYSQTTLQLLPGQAIWYQHRDTGIEWIYPRPR